ncbi:FMN-linked oxidoreductase [Aulographum hederae CBS 113979]|uniref:FMN-linked oxidoreductase n=1 Tax=Aulographum hederae CBS 113979 TaxID=1176131 RepID=A0A6G1HHX6_9PEZI|nr:FMN-linked oxidoreductase [Aulographum hederae CBS 113979]
MAASLPKQVPIPKNGTDYRGKVVLAPMVRSGELPSRLLALKYGADLVWGPETIDRSMIGTTRSINPSTGTVDFTRPSSNVLRDPSLRETGNARDSVIYRLHPELEKGRLIFQIGTSSPTLAVQAAKLVAADVAGIDVNAGCPKPFSTSGGMGAALLKTPDTLCDILTALVEEVGTQFEIGISVKIRLLSTPEETEALVSRLVKTGITALTIHCRTTPMRPRERAIREQLKMIVRVCHEAGVACVMNGDVYSRGEALQLMDEYGADGAMIATAAEKNPSVFRSEADGGLAYWKEIMREYTTFALQVENRWGNTKFLLAQHIPGKSEEAKKMVTCKGYGDSVRALGLEGMDDRAKEVDERLAIDTTKVSKATKRARAREGEGNGGGHKKPKRKQQDEERKEVVQESSLQTAAPAALAV